MELLEKISRFTPPTGNKKTSRVQASTYTNGNHEFCVDIQTYLSPNTDKFGRLTLRNSKWIQTHKDKIGVV